MYKSGIWHILSKGWVILAAVVAFALVWTMQQAQAESPTLGSAEHLVTIYDRGQEQTIVTRGKTVQAALDQAKVNLNDADIVEPARESELLAKNYNINIYRARPVIVRDGSVSIKIFTAAQSPEAIAKQAGVELYDEDITQIVRTDNMVETGGAALALEIDRATAFSFNLYGKEFIARTQAATVGEMLKEKGVELGDKDGVSPSSKTALKESMSVRVWRDGKQTLTVEEKIKMPVEEIQDQDRPIGYREVKTPGAEGVKQVTYEVILRNGEEIKRKKVTSVVTKKPVKEVVIVGAKNNYSGSLNEWLSALRGCEAGGRYDANTGNGFYGAYQFMPGTWDRIAGMTGRNHLVGVLPHKASSADQDAMIIDNTKLSSGGLATQNPGCYQKLGLSAFPPN